MAKQKRSAETNQSGWLALARSESVQGRIVNEEGLDDFQAVIEVVARRGLLDWDEAVAILHMVYAWMPTMLRPIAPHSSEQRINLLEILTKAKGGDVLSANELADVQKFANRSIVGASKLLHVLNPTKYPIWDSRVAEVFMWEGVTQGTFSTLDRYVEYLAALSNWAQDANVKEQCVELRKLTPTLANAGDMRLIELVLFRGKK